MQKFIHPTYTINHTCGHTVEKQILEGTEFKRRQVKKAMESLKCLACLEAQAKN